jgi:hypothetical protein
MKYCARYQIIYKSTWYLSPEVRCVLARQHSWDIATGSPGPTTDIQVQPVCQRMPGFLPKIAPLRATLRSQTLRKFANGNDSWILRISRFEARRLARQEGLLGSHPVTRHRARPVADVTRHRQTVIQEPIKGFPDRCRVGSLNVGKPSIADQRVDLTFPQLDRGASQALFSPPTMPPHPRCTGRPHRSVDAMTGQSAGHLNILAHLVEWAFRFPY